MKSKRSRKIPLTDVANPYRREGDAFRCVSCLAFTSPSLARDSLPARRNVMESGKVVARATGIRTTA